MPGADPGFAAVHAARSERMETGQREALLRTRTRHLAVIKAFVRREGLRPGRAPAPTGLSAARAG